MVSNLFGRLWAVMIAILLFAPVGAGALGPTLLINCLKAAERVQLATYKEKHEYIFDEKLLLEKLTPGCVELKYTISKTGKGFRISSRLNNESWEIDNFDNLTKLNGVSPAYTNSKQARPKAETSTADSPETPAAPSDSKSIASSAGFPKPLTERTDKVPKSWTPPPGTEQSEPPKVSSSTESDPGKDAKSDSGIDLSVANAKEPRDDKTEDADDVAHLRVCFAKALAQTPECKKILEESKIKCVDSKNDSELCTAYRAQTEPPQKTKVPRFVADALESSAKRQPTSTSTMRRTFEQMNALSAALQTLLLEMAQRMADLESQNSQLRKDNENLRNSLETLQTDVKAIKSKVGNK